jgi:hypothetical protein
VEATSQPHVTALGMFSEEVNRMLTALGYIFGEFISIRAADHEPPVV